MDFSLFLGKYYGIDSLVELLIVIVSFVIFYYSYRVYKLINEKNYKYFSLAFLFIGISFLFKIISNITLYKKIVIENVHFVYTFWYQAEYMQLINFVSFILYKCFQVIGFLILFLIVSKNDNREKAFLFVYMSLIVVFFSIFYNFIFHMTLVLILIFLIEYFYQNSKKVKSINSNLVLIAFSLILIAHSLFIFAVINSIFYLFGEIILLIGFSFLLLNQINLKKKANKSLKANETKTYSNRGYKRPLRGFAKK